MLAQCFINEIPFETTQWQAFGLFIIKHEKWHTRLNISDKGRTGIHTGPNGITKHTLKH